MKSEDLLNAMSDISPRLILDAEQPPKRKLGKRLTIFLVAAIIAVFGSVSIFAAQKWSRPRAETYQGSLVKVQEETSYTQTEDGSYAASETVEPDETEKSSETGMTEHQAISETLDLLQKLDCSVLEEQLTVTRETNEYWNREELRVTFQMADGNQADVSFDAQDGVLLRISALKDFTEGGTPMDEESVIAAAESYYQMLPYVQGYQYSGISKFDEGAWMVMFTREVTVTVEGQSVALENSYEQVRITVNPQNGEFLMSNAFYVPLLDDHSEGDTPITSAQAEKIASEYDKWGDEWSISTELAIVLPNTFYDGQSDGFSRAYDVTRLAWVITAERYVTEQDEETGEEIEWYDENEVYVDLYTGEVLGGDAIG